MAEDPEPMTLQQRIAALNAAHIGRVPGEPPRPTQRPAPQIPTRRPIVTRQKSINNPPEQVNGSVCDIRLGNQPAPPPPLPVRKQPPPLPARKSSQEESRRGSAESLASSYTNDGNGALLTLTKSGSSDRIKAPAWGECELPVLPSKGAQPAQPKYSNERPKYVNRAPSSSTSITPATTPERRPSVPTLPPRLPARKVVVEHHEHVPEPEFNKIPPMPSLETLEKAKRSALSFGLNAHQPAKLTPSGQPLTNVNLPAVTSATMPERRATSVPPPIPLGSRPDLLAIRGSKPKPALHVTEVDREIPSSSDVCLVCRDFSGPDHYATLFPRNQVSSLQNLAVQLTSPFPSLTDKARAIFTWLHHNVAYDVDNFFRGTIKGSTPQSTLQTGLAVCEGYAALFTNLATYAGLESVVVPGHGKGYGYTPLGPGQPIPPFDTGHAWNAVRIDNGEWKLIDACWGAGHVQGTGMPYVAKFTPEYFSMPNEEFSIKHFPANREHFFLPGGRSMSWEEYIQIDPKYWPSMVEPPTVFTNAKEDYAIGEKTVSPRNRKIHVGQNGVIRFQFGLLCPHWTLERSQKGRPPVFMIMTHGLDGRKDDSIPMEHVKGDDKGGDVWYVDIAAKELGAPGQTVTLFAVRSFGNRQDARGLTVKEFKEGKGRVAMGFTGVAAWDLI